MSTTFRREVVIARPAAEVFAWHERPGAFERLSPPWERVEVRAQRGGIRDGGRVELRTRAGPGWMNWTVEHFDYRPGELFCDRQVSGPFARWEHFHRFEPVGVDACRLVDEIHYALPGGAAASAVMGGWIHRKLDRLFTYRHAVTRADLELAPARGGRVLISGATGLLGSALAAFLSTQGWTVDRLVRRAPRATSEIRWDPTGGRIEWPTNYVCDAVVHLAGAGIAEGRWSEARKREILRSRVEGTEVLVREVARLGTPPAVWLNGSATGIYGDRGDQSVDEGAVAGEGFLAGVCTAWEDAGKSMVDRGTRWVGLRTGVVLTPAGGALARMLPPFQVGLGGRLGSGRQWLSWISLDDWLRACRHALVTTTLAGPVNLVAPGAVRQAEFASVLGRVVRRPAWFPVPATVLRLVAGSMADEALLASTRVAPGRLADTGFEFLHASLEKALRHVLGRTLDS